MAAEFEDDEALETRKNDLRPYGFPLISGLLERASWLRYFPISPTFTGGCMSKSTCCSRCRRGTVGTEHAEHPGTDVTRGQELREGHDKNGDLPELKDMECSHL